MLYSIKNLEELENLNDLVSLQNQVHEIRSQDNLGEQLFHENTKKLLEPDNNTIKNTSEHLTKTITESFLKQSSVR